ncbi:MAG: hypothetical protein Q8M11_00660 [Sulfuritalea sp.]|nr:hypothetical protein [Sulfuritalea sp.]MDP1984351.1 hypothetical protein [Sulfuritalea sp.]
MTRYLLSFLAGTLISLSAGASDSYLCTAELTTGFSFDSAKKKWTNAVFRSEKKLVIAKAKQKPYAWEVKEVGDARPGATCEQDFNEAGNLFCTGIFDIRFNSRKLKFLYVYPIGYWSDDDKGGMSREGANTPAMAIGKCSVM